MKKIKKFKMKTNSALKKRIRLTATGLVKAEVGYKCHFLTFKSKRMNRSHGTKTVSTQELCTLKKYMQRGGNF